MKIYHYTSIPTLALILHSGKMRFNRLDRVDDIEESAYGSGPLNIKLSQYHFVSCWTKSSEENLALWNMYTRYRGVRICMESVPFKIYKVNETFMSLIPEAMKFGDDYFVTQVNNPAILYDVEYVDDPQKEISKLVTHEGETIHFDTNHVGIYKRKEWTMQNESRFKLVVFPFDSEKAVNDLKDKEHTIFNVLMCKLKMIGPAIQNNQPIATSHIDLDLDTEKLNHIEVMLGPLTTEADNIIVESLLSPFPDSKLFVSSFKGKIRDKQ